MSGFEAALLGVIQGLTEFLPVSSSAHLILAREVFGWDAGALGLAFDVSCHVGTLIAVLLFFRHDVVAMLVALPAALRGSRDNHAGIVRSIVIGTTPVLFAGLLFSDFVTSTLRTPEVVVVALVLGSVAMLVSERVSSGNRAGVVLTGFEAFGIGLVQAAALIPGVSRAGAVIVMAMLFGVRRDSAARFAFLLGIPAIMAAASSQAIGLLAEGIPEEVLVLFGIGMVSSAVVGYVTVKYFIQYLSKHSMDAFAFYRIALAGCALFVFL